MPRRGENIYKRKDGRWEGRYIKSRDSIGKAQYGYVYAKTYRDLKLKLNNKVAEKKYALNHSIAECDQSFDYIAHEWLETQKAYVKESTFLRYSYLINHYISPVLGNYKISILQSKDINDFSSMLLSTGGKNGTGLSTKTVADIVCLIKCIMKYTMLKGNPTSYNGDLTPIKQHTKKMRVLSKTEQKLITNHLLNSSDLKDIGIFICLYTGIRVGELCALRWQDISLIEHTISIKNTLQRVNLQISENNRKTKILISAPKSQCSLRTIPIPSEIVHLMQPHSSSPDSFFLTGRQDQYIEPRTMQNHFKRILERNHIEAANFHCLRHTFATRCIEVGFDIKSLSEILGHANINITMNRYVHPTMDLKRENMNRLSILFAVK